MDAQDKPRYHHGALREALIAAAEAELEASGVEAFSLRKVAKRAGVSHAAPAHHFGDANGLLTALAAHGFGIFVRHMQAREAQAPNRFPAAGLGYIDFALAHPSLFRLIFSSARPDYEAPELAEAGFGAFKHLCGLVEAHGGVSPFDDAAAMEDAAAVWAIAHGLADLLASGRMQVLQEMDAATREATLTRILTRALPDGPAGR